MSKHFELEQQILECWQFTEDLQLFAEEHEDDDEICNKVLGMKHVYEMRFNKLWEYYEDAIEEYYALRKLNESKVNFDEEEA